MPDIQSLSLSPEPRPARLPSPESLRPWDAVAEILHCKPHQAKALVYALPSRLEGIRLGLRRWPILLERFDEKIDEARGALPPSPGSLMEVLDEKAVADAAEDAALHLFRVDPSDYNLTRQLRLAEAELVLAKEMVRRLRAEQRRRSA